MGRSREFSTLAIMTLVITACAIPFLVVELWPSRLYHVIAVAHYLVFHNIAEFMSVMVSLSTFGVGWYTFNRSGNRHVLFLGTAFLAIGLMDFMHTLGYAGMPAFITPNSANKSTQFWIAARLFTAAAFFASAFIEPDSRSVLLSKRLLMTIAVAASALVFSAVTFGFMPPTFIEGAGLTPFKKISEYIAILLFFLATVGYGKRMKRTGDRSLVYYMAAFIICIFSELVFAVYKSVFDTYNVLGHLYKTTAFFLIYRGLFVTGVIHPYVKLAETGEKLEQDIAERRRAEENVFLMSFALDRVREAAFLIDENARFQFVNEESCRVLGYAREELLALGVPDVDPDLPAERWPDHWKELKARRSLRFEGRHRTKDGEVFPVEINANYFEYNGRAYNLVMVRDITERRWSEEALKKSEQRYRMVFENSPVSIREEDFSSVKAYLDDLQKAGVVDIEAYLAGRPEDVRHCLERRKLLDANRAALELYQAGGKEELLAAFAGTFTPESVEMFRQEIVRLWSGRTSLTADTVIRTLPGGLRNVTVYFAVCPGYERTLSKVFVSMIDITERKHLVEELKFSEEKFSRAFQASPNLMAITRSDGRIVEINESFCRFFGYRPEECIGHNTTELGMWVDPDQRTSAIRVLDETGAALYMTVDLRTKTGEIRTTLDSIVYINIHDQKYLLSVATDITERKRAEEALLSLNEKLEQMVKERTAELESKIAQIERMNKLFVGRELKMVELKQQIEHLEKKLQTSNAA